MQVYNKVIKGNKTDGGNQIWQKKIQKKDIQLDVTHTLI